MTTTSKLSRIVLQPMAIHLHERLIAEVDASPKSSCIQIKPHFSHRYPFIRKHVSHPLDALCQ